MANWAKMMSKLGQANSSSMPANQKVIKAEELTFVSINIVKNMSTEIIKQ
jgi:hypothetical protein